MRKKFLSMSLALGLVASLFVGVIGAGAQNGDDDNVLFSSAYFPFVPNGEVVDGTGPWYGSVSIQNADYQTIRVFALDSVAFDQELSGSLWNTTIQPNASKTFSANQILDGDGSALVLLAVTEEGWQALNDDDNDNGDNGFYRAPAFGAVLKQAAPEPLTSSARTSGAHMIVDGHTAIPGADVAWGRNSEFCYGYGDVDACLGTGSYFFGLGIFDTFDGSSYLPIVQTNSGWNTVIVTSNIDASIQNAGVNITLIPSQGSTFGSGQIQETFTLNPGETNFLNLADFLADQGITSDWVGSAWIESDVGVVSSALRLKASTNMLAINTAVPSILQTQEQFNGIGPAQVGSWGNYELYGPLVFKEYNGWNTGISLVNNAEITNTVNITFYGPTGNAMQSESLTLPPRGSNFLYSPSLQDAQLNPGFVGSVVMSGQLPFHAAVDQVKYSTGEAMSYTATQVGIGYDNWFGSEKLFMPLVQKGNVNGMGDTSGVQLFNATSNSNGHVYVDFYLSGGSLAAPTQNASIELTLTPLSTATLYTMNYSQMPANFLGSVQVTTASYGGNVVGVSNNVNYAVNGDGSTAFNMINNYGQYRTQLWWGMVLGGE